MKILTFILAAAMAANGVTMFVDPEVVRGGAGRAGDRAA